MSLARSYLFVPGDRPERFAKALASGADAVVLDLEDAVVPAAKAAARDAVSAFVAGSPQRQRIVLRVNAADSEWFAADCELLAWHPGLSVMLPKAHDVAVLQALHHLVPGMSVLPLVESAAGVLAIEALAAAPGVLRLVFGTLDFALEMGLEGDLASTVGLDFAASRIALASRAAGIAAPVAGVTPAIDDEPLLLAEWARARAHGFGAKLCIHPRQIAAVHRALAPSVDELAWAQRVLQAVDNAGTAQGAVQLDGRMVDKPVIERARRLLARAIT